MQMLPSVKRLANFAGKITNIGRKANDIIKKNTPKKNKIEKFFQFSAANWTSCILFVKPFSVVDDFDIPFDKFCFIEPNVLDSSPVFSSSLGTEVFFAPDFENNPRTLSRVDWLLASFGNMLYKSFDFGLLLLSLFSLFLKNFIILSSRF